jgi:hypothetical protein
MVSAARRQRPGRRQLSKDALQDRGQEVVGIHHYEDANDFVRATAILPKERQAADISLHPADALSPATALN